MKAKVYKKEIRVYNRNEQREPIATDAEVKRALKKLGFVWDRYNKSYVVESVSENIIEQLRSMMMVEFR